MLSIKTSARASGLARQSFSRRVPAVMRATEGESKANEGTIFFAGESYTEAQWQEAKRSGKIAVATAPATVQEISQQQPQASFGDVMAFAGAAPEVVNGRLAMLGFVAALAAELSTDETVTKQLSDEPTGILATFILVIAGSLVTIMQRKEGKLSLGPFTAAAEMTNGRAAMIGFAALVGIELARGAALF